MLVMKAPLRMRFFYTVSILLSPMLRSCYCLLNRSGLIWHGAVNAFTGLNIWQPNTRMPIAHHDFLQRLATTLLNILPALKMETVKTPCFFQKIDVYYFH